MPTNNQDVNQMLQDYAEGKAIGNTLYSDRKQTILLTTALLEIAQQLKQTNEKLNQLAQILSSRHHDDHVAHLKSLAAVMSDPQFDGN